MEILQHNHTLNEAPPPEDADWLNQIGAGLLGLEVISSGY